MSDRIAVFNQGRIEQVGTAREVYERPASAFVAGFVGTSNLLQGAAARALVGRDGVFTVRPEKIRLITDERGERAGDVVAPGRVAEVVYVGSATRYVVRLDAGGELVVVRQNDEDHEVDGVRRDDVVRLAWRKEHVYPVGEPGEQSQDGESAVQHARRTG